MHSTCSRFNSAARNLARMRSAFAHCSEQIYLASADVTDQASVDQLVSELPQQWQPIDVLVTPTFDK